HDALPIFPAAVIQFVFDNDQIAFLVDSQQVQALPGIVKAIEFLLDNQQLVAITLGQCLGVILQPFLQVFALGKAEVAEAFYLQRADTVGGGVDLKHWLAPPRPQYGSLRRIRRVRQRGVWAARNPAVLRGCPTPGRYSQWLRRAMMLVSSKSRSVTLSVSRPG